jgi:hypothetical protein
MKNCRNTKAALSASVQRIRVGYASMIGMLLLLLALCPSARAQGTGGTLSGTVTDSAQHAVPGAEITILNNATGQARKLVSNERGYYSAANLPPGSYELKVSATGFKIELRSKLVIEVGQELVVDTQLQVGDVKETVQVTTEPASVNTTTSAVSNVVAGQTVRDLPINGRDWTLMAALEPGVHPIEAQLSIAGGGNTRANRGYGTQLTIGGNRPQQNHYRLDGITINDYSGSGPGDVIGVALGVDAIQEFSVITGNASADVGRTSGGVINAVTRSGENQLHGSVYEFLRNKALDARNFFDGATVPPFQRNQFGGSIGGPVYLPRFGEGGPAIGYKGKNKTFFFVDYEGLRQNLGTTTVTTVLSRNARAGKLTSGTVTIHPSILPFLNIFPLPNGAETGDFGTYSFSSQTKTTENLVTARVDHKFSNADSMFGTFFTDNANAQGPDGFNFVILGQLANRKTASIEETHIFNPSLINIARVGFNRVVVRAPIALGPNNPLAIDTSLGFLPGNPVGAFQVSGLTRFDGGVGGVAETNYFYTSYQGYDDLEYIKGEHSFKFGASIERIQSNEFAATDPLGKYTFGSVKNFLINQPTNFDATIPGSASKFYLRQTVFGAYAHDDFRIRPNLTLNLGLRYEIATLPNEKYNRLATLVNLTDKTATVGSLNFRNPTLRNFSPRVGFAWDPFKDGKTSVRGGFGIYDTLPLTYQFTLLIVNVNPFTQSGLVSTLPVGSFPTGGFPRLTANTASYAYVQPNPRRSYVQQWSLNIERQLFGFVARVGYSAEHGVHQPFRSNDVNAVVPTVTPQGLVWPLRSATGAATGTQINPSAGQINAIAWLASNTYNGLNVGVTRRQKGMRLGVSYTWSKSLDNSSASMTGGTFLTGVISPLILFPQYMRGLSDFDVRHNFVFNYLWEIPGPKSANGVFKWATNGWQLGGIYRAASGLPFTPAIGGDALGSKNANPFNMPDRVDSPACKNPVNPGNPDHYIKTECFVAPNPGSATIPPTQVPRLGNAGRNSVIGPGISNFDLSLVKNNKIRERTEVQFRAEFFNVFNHPNFQVPDRTVAQLFNQSLAPITTAGRLIATSTTSRQIQFALKLTF